jgi:hypothetical protein
MTTWTVRLLPIMIFYIATSAGGAYAAGVPRAPQTTSKPHIVFPLTTRPGRQGGSNKNAIAAPTPDLSLVASNLEVQEKSLNTLVTVAPGLTLTKPVTISIAYVSPFPAGNERRTETYSSTNGNSFLYSDLEGDGKVRKIHMDITLSEPRAGGVVSFDVPLDFSLDPLYDVEISPLLFTLVRGCANIGANQISVHWYPPDAREVGKYQTVHFATKEQEKFNLREFSWSRSEVSAAAGLHKVVVWYAETGIHGGFGPIAAQSEENLVPGKTYRSPVGLINSMGSTQDCEATLDYTVTYQLRAFLGAPTIRDHR